MLRREKILEGLDLEHATGLEIGALCNPLVLKSQSDVYYVDYASTPFLKARYASDPTVAVEKIVEVDFVWGERSLEEITGGRKFDYIVASHVIKHVPDLITWLHELKSVLKPTGSIRLAVPDRRYTVDYLRRETRLADALDAYLRRSRRPLPAAIIDHMLNIAHVDCRAAWDFEPVPSRLRRYHTLEDAMRCAREALEEGTYHDVHCSIFTPASFAGLLEEISRHDLLALSCDRFWPTERYEAEFLVSLRHARDRGDAIQSWQAARSSAQRAAGSSAAPASTRAASDEVTAALQLRVQELTQEVAALHASTSWRITRPVRTAVLRSRQLARLARAARESARYRGGVIPMLWAAAATVRKRGWHAEWLKLRGHALGPNAAAGPAAQQSLYDRWIARQSQIDAEARERQPAHLQSRIRQPLLSILMPTFNTPPQLLEQAIASVRKQSYPHWELCIADDASTDPQVVRALEAAAAADQRIRFVRRDTNGHISAASNSALELATGEFVALLDHDDELHPMALYWVARELDQHPDASLIYTDEDKIDESGCRSEPYFKSDLNYELLLSHNMICHLGVYRRSLVLDLGGFRTGFEGAQDYDLALRVVERLKPDQVRHIPKVLYHWRVHQDSTAAGGSAKPYAQAAGQRAVGEHLQRVALAGEVVEAPEAPGMIRVRFARPQPEPDVEIIIPTRDRADLMRMSVGSVLNRTAYQNYRICIVDNGSVENETLELFRQWRGDPRIRIVRDERPFNFSALNNLGVRTSACSFVCLLNNDIEVLTPDWLSEMISHAGRPGVGCVGARLWYPNETLQHGGVVLGLQGIAGHSHKHLARGNPGYFGRAVLQQAFSAVTAACLLIRRDIYLEVGGLDEDLAVAFNDVDFCLRVREAGYRNVWTPYAELYHHESVSRGYENNPEKQARFVREIEFMKQRWAGQLLADPCYSPNLTMMAEDFSIGLA